MRQESLLKDQSSSEKFCQHGVKLNPNQWRAGERRRKSEQDSFSSGELLSSDRFLSKDFHESQILTIVLFLIPDLLSTISFEMNFHIIILLNFGTSVHHITENENPQIYTSGLQVLYYDLPSLQLSLMDQILHQAPTCPWGPRGRPLLWALVHRPHPWCKGKKMKPMTLSLLLCDALQLLESVFWFLF